MSACVITCVESFAYCLMELVNMFCCGGKWMKLAQIRAQLRVLVLAVFNMLGVITCTDHVTLCGLVYGYQHFKITCSLHLSSTKTDTAGLSST